MEQGGGNEIDQWIWIQEKTFTNWVNEQLKVSGRSVKSISTDLCDGVNLVALVEALQFRKIGKVYPKPSGKIQMLQNVALAFKALADDNIKLVNIGNEDVVNGNAKLTLGLIWSLVQRYQISSRKDNRLPKKLMISWFRTVLPDLDITNFTTDWNDGIALHALLEHLKPGMSPNWKKLHSKDRAENCRTAMNLFKDHFNIPIVVHPKDFANDKLDELSAMTYLSYLVKAGSPGYYDTLNWVCKQLRNTNITNLTTDWNDGYYLCAIVHSLGGEGTGYPNIDRNRKVENCQRGMDAGQKLGVEPLLSASEMADPNVDHLTMMAYISKFRAVLPRKNKNEKIEVISDFDMVKVGTEFQIRIQREDNYVDIKLIGMEVQDKMGKHKCALTWADRIGQAIFIPKITGEHKLFVTYDGVTIKDCPIEFIVKADSGRATFEMESDSLRIGKPNEISVDLSEAGKGELIIETISPIGNLHYPSGEQQGLKYVAEIQPNEVANTSMAGEGQITAIVAHNDSSIPVNIEQSDEDENTCEITFVPDEAGTFTVHAFFNGDEVPGSPKSMSVTDPGLIKVSGDGIVGGTKGTELKFTVDAENAGGVIDVDVIVEGKPINVMKHIIASNRYEYRYRAISAGTYMVHVKWNGKDIPESPYRPKITDRSKIIPLDDLTDRKDENGYFVLDCDKETALRFDISQAGPGNFTAEVLAPKGRLPVAIRKSKEDIILVGFTARQEGNHYIHLFWSDVPLDMSPILAYCPGPVLPVDYTKVLVTGQGCATARAMVKAEFMIDGRKAGPGIPRAQMYGVKANVDIEMKALKYDRYMCNYTAPTPGGYLLYVFWSEETVPGTPFKVSVLPKGRSNKVLVTGSGLKGGYVGQELCVNVDSREAGNGEVTADFNGKRETARCDKIDHKNGIVSLRLYPTEANTHTLFIKYDGEDVPGSPFKISVGEPPDPRKVRCYGPGIEDGVIQNYESRFIVETFGAGAGQLAVRIRGPKGAFAVDMQRDSQTDRVIVCRYDPLEAGKYIIGVKWSGVHVPWSPFQVNIFETREELHRHWKMEKGINISAREQSEFLWKDEI
ncbi:hypothetical protein CHS0354_022370 [Potamilus streckersoni]|uniref:Calponin-homology (CH) domain-containing protein n=1 Tax=Potamilus streckersoni TaxID=2493646 RepID=A0AAE0T298_9BIVA|nr:hypothetical protein CHS0354_022370 [Potamilus streckersoni]